MRGSPRSSVLRGTPTPRRSFRAASFPSPSGTTLDTLGSRSTGGDVDRLRRSLGMSRLPGRCGLLMETTGSPRFLGSPFAYAPCSKTPTGPGDEAVAAPRMVPSALTTASAPAWIIVSRLDHTARMLAVYASQGRSPATTQDSLPAAWPAWPGGIGYPLGSVTRFRQVICFLLVQASPGAPWVELVLVLVAAGRWAEHLLSRRAPAAPPPGEGDRRPRLWRSR